MLEVDKSTGQRVNKAGTIDLKAGETFMLKGLMVITVF